MNQSASPTKSRLAAIASNAMRGRGLLPEFSPAAIAELGTLAQAATPPQPSDGIRDLRELPGFRIDNDDSRDLDQLSVAGSRYRGRPRYGEGGVTRGEARFSIGGHARTNKTSVLTPAAFP